MDTRPSAARIRTILRRPGPQRRATVEAVTDLLIVVGARPNFMKAASVVQAAEQARLASTLVHTGQHYDPELSRVFFEELGLPEPDVFLGIGSGSHAAQTANIMQAFEEELLRIRPSIVVVVGDVNSTLACALVAVKERFPVAHVEAGLRCYDPWMPEEINRRLCDHVCSYLFTTGRDAVENLRREGIAGERVSFVGNTMIDTLLRFREAARRRGTPQRFGLAGRPYAVVTLHRPDNVDDPAQLAGLVEALSLVGRCVPVVFPLHPRTRSRLEEFGLDRVLADGGELLTCPSLGYLDFLGLVADASLVLTDSGGVQEETTVLDVPCLTLRESTERPVTVTAGTNRVVGGDPERIVEESLAVLESPPVGGRVPELWDGRAGERIVAHLRAELFEGLPLALAG
jgi:UDP-N-acetylglucosamine 2-epimerase (non-hydrolysing)